MSAIKIRFTASLADASLIQHPAISFLIACWMFILPLFFMNNNNAPELVTIRGVLG